MHQATTSSKRTKLLFQINPMIMIAKRRTKNAALTGCSLDPAGCGQPANTTQSTCRARVVSRSLTTVEHEINRQRPAEVELGSALEFRTGLASDGPSLRYPCGIPWGSRFACAMLLEPKPSIAGRFPKGARREERKHIWRTTVTSWIAESRWYGGGSGPPSH